jgi:hypothetical protein
MALRRSERGRSALRSVDNYATRYKIIDRTAMTATKTMLQEY